MIDESLIKRNISYRSISYLSTYHLLSNGSNTFKEIKEILQKGRWHIKIWKRNDVIAICRWRFKKIGRAREKDKERVTTICVVICDAFSISLSLVICDAFSISLSRRNLLVSSETESYDYHNSRSIVEYDDCAYTVRNMIYVNKVTFVIICSCGDYVREKNREILICDVMIAVVIVDASIIVVVAQQR